MPITPFHFGPGAALKAALGQRMSFTIFAAGQRGHRSGTNREFLADGRPVAPLFAHCNRRYRRRDHLCVAGTAVQRSALAMVEFETESRSSPLFPTRTGHPHSRRNHRRCARRI